MEQMEIYPGITAHRGTLGGKPVVKGTRVPVDLVLGQLASGMTMEEVASEYDLTIDAIRAALGYAAERMSEEVVLGFPG
jgi:uncharacterized protein (DUF433 family)